MRSSTHRGRGICAPAARRADARLRAALQAQWEDAPELFSDRDDEAREYASILRDFACRHDEALDAGSQG